MAKASPTISSPQSPPSPPPDRLLPLRRRRPRRHPSSSPPSSFPLLLPSSPSRPAASFAPRLLLSTPLILLILPPPLGPKQRHQDPSSSSPSATSALSDIQLASRAVLPKFYAADVRDDSWKVFSRCGGRKVIVTANPRVMVEEFVREYLGGEKVLGTEVEVDERTGRATGFVKGARREEKGGEALAGRSSGTRRVAWGIGRPITPS
ncbi:uncharacterized protein A4U43_C01F8730 [Asparagus officinalis]|uniref:Glycerol-3-phosphate acyltransferase RAM2/GPAT1-8 HAD-like domain-containing protein n=1 Tax=Asparagus officinalis TaxID=4686 RepID=A0A5P1FNH4_ASPOF|nr:uncharacterized protein A4U43_C01F8730 [Asparagus officinalis]